MCQVFQFSQKVVRRRKLEQELLPGRAECGSVSRAAVPMTDIGSTTVTAMTQQRFHLRHVSWHVSAGLTLAYETFQLY